MKEKKNAVTISICMIVRNEEAVLDRCLKSIEGVYDQLVIVDTGSLDNTIAIAKNYTDEVYLVPWENDFGKARNKAFSYAKCDYVMYMDADDVLPEKEKEKLMALKLRLATMEDSSRPRTITMLYDVPEAGGISSRTRMMARHEGPYWVGVIHERVYCEEPVIETDILILHRKLVLPPADRNCNIIRSIPMESLKCDIWLCAQCYLDMLLAGHFDEAKEYYRIISEEYDQEVELIFSTITTLIHHKLWEQALELIELADSHKVNDNNLAALLCQQGVKACLGMDRLKEAIAYNERVLKLAPDNTAALLNRAFLEKKRKEQQII